MITLDLLLMALFFAGAGYVQWKYAEANYPTTWQWKTLLFASGFGSFAISAWLLPISDLSVIQQALLIGGGGLLGGYGSLALFPQKMQMIRPKQE